MQGKMEPFTSERADKITERQNFMKPNNADPLKKREDFAVSLRKKKKNEIIQGKRRRLQE